MHLKQQRRASHHLNVNVLLSNITCHYFCCFRCIILATALLYKLFLIKLLFYFEIGLSVLILCMSNPTVKITSLTAAVELVICNNRSSYPSGKYVVI